MSIKTITVTEDAYEAMKRLKFEDESFSELFKRLSSKNATARDILGMLKHSPEESKAFRRRVKEAGDRLDKGIREGIEDVRSRLKRNH